ncbi:hypothetical protein PanWU01x14_028920, partial [Parasponia andersonii]
TAYLLGTSLTISDTIPSFVIDLSRLLINGGLGSSDHSGGAVRAVEPRSVVSDSSQRQSGRVWQHADKWRFHIRPRHYLLRPHHYLPHRH